MSCRELTAAYLDAAKRENPALNAYILITEEEALRLADAADSRRQKGRRSPARRRAVYPERQRQHEGRHHDVRLEDARQLRPDFRRVYLGSSSVSAAPFCSEKATWTSSPWARRARRASTARKQPAQPRPRRGRRSSGPPPPWRAATTVVRHRLGYGRQRTHPRVVLRARGLKPTGAISRRGVIAYGSSLDQIGPIAACAEDVALVFDAMCAKRRRYDERRLEPITPKLTGSVAGEENRHGQGIFRGHVTAGARGG